MRKLRLGIFGLATRPADGGANTLLPLLMSHVPAAIPSATLEIVAVPWAAWSYRRRPLRFAWLKVARAFGNEIPLVDLRTVCRQFRLDFAYFPAPVYARIDIPFVFTVWDLGHRTIPGFPEVRAACDPWTQREAMYRRMLTQADYIVVGNRTGAAEVVAHYGVESARCVPLPFPNPDFTGIEAAVPSWLPAAPYFLCPAQLWPHKNHVTLLRALALMPVPGDQSRRPHLVFTGTDKGNQAYLESVVAELGLGERVHFAGFVSRAELKGLYQQATALAFPSLLGPNNLPPQEAAVLGCPMILSDLPGHREQMGAGARYAGACDAAAWATEMQQLLGSPDLARALVALAREAVAPYGLGAYAAGLNGIVARMAETRQLWGA